MYRQKLDLNTNKLIQDTQTNHLGSLNDLLSDIKDNALQSDNFMSINISSFTNGNISHTPTETGYISGIGAEAKYTRVLIYGKYTPTTATDFFTICFSSSTTFSPTSPPNNNELFRADNIRGTTYSDTNDYHFGHIIEGIPRYITFGNFSGNTLTNFELHFRLIK
jgi:hypothetical protein